MYMKICVVGDVVDVITCAKFQNEIFRGYNFTWGRIFHSSYWFWMGLTTVQRYCAACDTDGVTPNGDTKYRWSRLRSAVFNQYLAISQKWCKITMEANRNSLCTLSNGAIFNDLEEPLRNLCIFFTFVTLCKLWIYLPYLISSLAALVACLA